MEWGYAQSEHPLQWHSVSFLGKINDKLHGFHNLDHNQLDCSHSNALAVVPASTFLLSEKFPAQQLLSELIKYIKLIICKCETRQFVSKFKKMKKVACSTSREQYTILFHYFIVFQGVDNMCAFDSPYHTRSCFDYIGIWH